MVNIIYKVGDKIKVLKGCSMQAKQESKDGGPRYKVQPMRGTIIGVYDHFFLVQHKNFKECYTKASLLCKDAIFKISK